MYFFEVFDIKMLVFRIDFIFVGEDIFLFEFSFVLDNSIRPNQSA